MIAAEVHSSFLRPLGSRLTHSGDLGSQAFGRRWGGRPHSAASFKNALRRGGRSSAELGFVAEPDVDDLVDAHQVFVTLSEPLVVFAELCPPFQLGSGTRVATSPTLVVLAGTAADP